MVYNPSKNIVSADQTGAFQAPTDNGSPNTPSLRQEFRKFLNAAHNTHITAFLPPSPKHPIPDPNHLPPSLRLNHVDY